MTKFAAYDETSIYAIGETPDAAIAKARADANDPEACFHTAQIGDNFAARIERDGWDGKNKCFDVRKGFIVDTTAGFDSLSDYLRA